MTVCYLWEADSVLTSIILNVLAIQTYSDFDWETSLPNLILMEGDIAKWGMVSLPKWLCSWTAETSVFKQYSSCPLLCNHPYDLSNSGSSRNFQQTIIYVMPPNEAKLFCVKEKQRSIFNMSPTSRLVSADEASWWLSCIVGCKPSQDICKPTLLLLL